MPPPPMHDLPPPPTSAAAAAGGSKVEQVGDLKEWIAKEIQQLLGEPEASLVDFIYDHATKHADRPMADLRPELQDVLEEDAPAFLDKLQEQVNQLNR